MQPMTRFRPRILFQLAIALWVLSLVSCVSFRQFRDNKPGDPRRQDTFVPQSSSCLDREHRPAGHDYYLGFIEFDDMGELWDQKKDNQLEHVKQLIDKAKQKSLDCGQDGRIQTVTFIHGWKNNASDDTGNVWGFRKALEAGICDRYYRAYGVSGSLSKQEQEACSSAEEEFGKQNEERRERSAREAPVPLVGIFIGWRGNVTNIPVVKEFTFWDRRDAAIRIPGPTLTAVLHDIMDRTKACLNPNDTNYETCPGSNSSALLVGHSFGGMVMERSLAQAMVQRILDAEQSMPKQVAEATSSTPQHVHVDPCENGSAQSSSDHQLRPPADLIVFVNSAAPATESRQTLTFLKDRQIHFCGVNPLALESDPKHRYREQPLFLAITSKGDTATNFAMPIGQYPSYITKSFRKYDPPEPPDIPKQSTYYIHSTANLAPLQSHSIKGCSKEELESGAPGDYDIRITINGKHYCILRKWDSQKEQDVWNTTPYWVMQMPADIVPDHGNIFTNEFQKLLAQLLYQFDNHTQKAGLKPHFTK